MNNMKHHIPEPLMAAYVSGNLPHAFAMVVASHIELCDSCRAEMGAHLALGGAVLDQTVEQSVSLECQNRVFALLDDAPMAEVAPVAASGIFPKPLMEAMNGHPPKWRSIGGGMRQSVLHRHAQGTARLLYIPAGQAVPEHGHGGLELTLVLQGAFEDETGYYGAGDLEVADGSIDHQPVATGDKACICLAATAEPLSFKSFLPRLFQPIMGI